MADQGAFIKQHACSAYSKAAGFTALRISCAPHVHNGVGMPHPHLAHAVFACSYAPFSQYSLIRHANVAAVLGSSQAMLYFQPGRFVLWDNGTVDYSSPLPPMSIMTLSYMFW